MSNWRYMFIGEGSNVGDNSQEVIDLVDDYGLDPADLEGKTESELESIVEPLWSEWFWNRYNGGWSRVEASEGEE